MGPFQEAFRRHKELETLQRHQFTACPRWLTHKPEVSHASSRRCFLRILSLIGEKVLPQATYDKF